MPLSFGVVVTGDDGESPDPGKASPQVGSEVRPYPSSRQTVRFVEIDEGRHHKLVTLENFEAACIAMYISRLVSASPSA